MVKDYKKAVKLLVDRYEFINGKLTENEKVLLTYGYLNGLKEAGYGQS